MRKLLLGCLPLFMALFALTGIGARAQQNIQITNSSAENRFPTEIVFSLAATGASPVESAFLKYRILPDGPLTTAQPSFTAGNRVQVTYQLRGNDPPRVYIHPGAKIEYFWELQDAVGDKFTTQKATITYDDIRFPWQAVSEGTLTVRWYGGSESAAASAVQAGRQTLDRMSALLGAGVPFPVYVWIYSNTADMQPAIQRRSETFHSQVTTLGERVSSDTVLMLRGGGIDTLRHELTHVVTKQAGEGPFGDLPAWLDEGTAMYSQENLGRNYEAALQSSLSRGRPLSLRSMTSPPGNPAAVDLFYGQSWSIVTYLVENYGEDSFARLYAVFKEGSTIDNALKAVYGIGVDELEAGWLAGLGLAPAPPPPAQPRPARTTAPEERQAQPLRGEEGDSGFPIVGAVAIASLGLGLVAMAFIGGRMLLRRRPR